MDEKYQTFITIPSTSRSTESDNQFRESIIKIASGNRYEIPQFIMAQEKNILWKCCCFLCESHKKYDLNNIDGNELKSYYELRNIAIQRYNPEIQKHEESLKFLFLSSLNCNLNNDLVSSEWIKVGFKTSNPREEFNDGGYFSLLFIIYFIKQNEEEYKEILINNYFPFAITAIQITYFSKLCLDLIFDYVEAEEQRKFHKLKSVNIPQFKAFIYNQQKYNNYVYDLMSSIVLELKKLIKINSLKHKFFEGTELKHFIKNCVYDVITRELDNEYNQISSSFSVYSVE